MVLAFPLPRVMQVACLLLLVPGVANFFFPHKANEYFGYPSEESLKNTDTLMMVRVLGCAH